MVQTKQRDIYLMIEDLNNGELTEEQISDIILGLPYNSPNACQMATVIGGLDNANTTHFSTLVSKSHHDFIAPLAKCLPYKKLAGECSEEELNKLAELVDQINDKCLDISPCKTNAKCPEPTECDIKERCPRHPFMQLRINFRGTVITEFNLDMTDERQTDPEQRIFIKSLKKVPASVANLG